MIKMNKLCAQVPWSIRCHGPKIRESVDNTLQWLSSIVFRNLYQACLNSQYAEEDTAF